MCKGCKHLWEDASVGAFECMKADCLTEEELDKYYTFDEDGCPCYEELVEEDYTV